MCGIFGLFNYESTNINFIQDQFMKGKHRGPESSVYKNVMVKANFGFHRLAINGLNKESDQPICIKDVVLICNGEIYNYKQLYDLMGVKPTTDSDCEVIIHLYMQYGIKQTMQMLDGVFSFCLIDYRLSSKTSKLYIGRDPYGIRPLYILKSNSLTKQSSSDNNIFAIASELKMLSEICNKENSQYRKNVYSIEQFQPGTYTFAEMIHNVSPKWKIIKNNVQYHTTGFSSCIYDLNKYTENNCNEIYKNIQYYLINAVEKRCCTTDRPIACLLSGGLDSSLITALVNEYNKRNGKKKLETYSIGIEGSDDLKYAKKVAEYLDTNHTEISLKEQDFLDAIPSVIYDIESYDTTTVRASIGNWLIGKYISEHSDAKVIFNGDGSDELTGGYLYVGSASNAIEYDKECRHLLEYIHTFDVLRSDKCISSHGLEPRTPFLDREWVQYYLTIPIELRCTLRKNKKTYVEKSLLRNAFHIDQYKNMNNEQLLPDEVLFRRKEAFSDGVSKQSRSLYEIIQEHAEKYIRDIILPETVITPLNNNDNYEQLCKLNKHMFKINKHLQPDTAEKFYYRYLFEKSYSGYGSILPFFWMPKYVNSKDSSARTLDIYKNNIEGESEEKEINSEMDVV